jgi:hypothetical protein
MENNCITLTFTVSFEIFNIHGIGEMAAIAKPII